MSAAENLLVLSVKCIASLGSALLGGAIALGGDNLRSEVCFFFSLVAVPLGIAMTNWELIFRRATRS